MIDYLTTEEEVRDLAEKIQAVGDKYEDIQLRWGECEWKVKKLLSTQQGDASVRKASFEKQVIMLIAIAEPKVEKLLHDFIVLEHQAKAQEMQFEAKKVSLSACQSLIRLAKSEGG